MSVTNSLEWVFQVQDRFSGPIAKMQAQIEKLEGKTVRAAKQTGDMFAKAAVRAQKEIEKAAQAQMRAAERAAAKQIREHQRVAAERRKLLKEAGGAIGGALGGAFGGRGGAEVGAIVGGFGGGGFGAGALLGIGTAVITSLIEGSKKLFESVFDAAKELSLSTLEHIKSIDATKFTLKQQLGEQQIKELERFNSNRDVLTSFGNNLGLLEEMEKKLTFATGGKLPIESIERTIQVINEMNSIRGGGAAGAEEMTQLLSKFAATGKIKPGKFFMDFFGGEDAVAGMFGLKGGQAEVRKKLEKMFAGGEIGFEDFINRTSKALAEKSGGAVGMTAVKRATGTIAGSWERLVNLPQVWAQKMESSGAADRLIALVNKVFDALDPNGPTGAKLYKAFDWLIGTVTGAIDELIKNPKLVDDVISGLTKFVTKLGEVASAIPIAISAIAGFVEFLKNPDRETARAINAGRAKGIPGWSTTAIKADVAAWMTVPWHSVNDSELVPDVQALLARGEGAWLSGAGLKTSKVRAASEGGSKVEVNVDTVNIGEGQDPHEAGKQFGEGLKLTIGLDRMRGQ